MKANQSEESSLFGVKLGGPEVVRAIEEMGEGDSIHPLTVLAVEGGDLLEIRLGHARLAGVDLQLGDVHRVLRYPIIPITKESMATYFPFHQSRVGQNDADGLNLRQITVFFE